MKQNSQHFTRGSRQGCFHAAADTAKYPIWVFPGSGLGSDVMPQPHASVMTQEEAGGRFMHRARALPLGITQAPASEISS